jgi:hypothetical protein
MDAGAILSHLGALIAGALGTYAAFYLRGALARREQVAKSLAAFYASAATAYYARKDYEQPRVLEQPSDRMAFYKLYDQHYQEFLSSSTLLASLVPPTLKDEVLSMEDLWDEISDEGFQAVSSKRWLDSLDALRDKILDSIRYSWLTDPYWRS